MSKEVQLVEIEKPIELGFKMAIGFWLFPIILIIALFIAGLIIGINL
jgi:hypothetical protein